MALIVSKAEHSDVQDVPTPAEGEGMDVIKLKVAPLVAPLAVFNVFTPMPRSFQDVPTYLY